MCARKRSRRSDETLSSLRAASIRAHRAVSSSRVTVTFFITRVSCITVPVSIPWSTTVADLPLEDAGWEDDDRRPRRASGLTTAFERTWAMIDDALRRWTVEDLFEEFTRTRRNGEVETFTRAWVVWHLIEHDLHHGGEISQILGTNGIPAPEL